MFSPPSSWFTCLGDSIDWDSLQTGTPELRFPPQSLEIKSMELRAWSSPHYSRYPAWGGFICLKGDTWKYLRFTRVPKTSTWGWLIRIHFKWGVFQWLNPIYIYPMGVNDMGKSGTQICPQETWILGNVRQLFSLFCRVEQKPEPLAYKGARPSFLLNALLSLWSSGMN